MQTSPNFTPQARVAIKNAKKIAIESRCIIVQAEHLALSIMSDRNVAISLALRHSKINRLELIDFIGYLVEALGMETEEALAQSSVGGVDDEDIEYSSSVKNVLSQAFDISLKFGVDYVGPEHLFLSLLASTACPLSEFLMASGSSVQQIYDALVLALNAEALAEDAIEDKPRPSSSPILKMDGQAIPFSTNFNLLALNNKLSKVVGKDKEINRVCEILSRKTKNNPILIGEPGVGKSAIVEGLAQNIVKGRIATHLLGKTIHSIDMASMLAGTKYRGSFEDRLKKIIKLASEDVNAVLFIDEVHSIVGAGSSEGTLDAANILKHPLSRGDLTCIGATTLSEYKKHILKDPALSRRFEPVFIEEPSSKESLEILSGVSESYENYHRVKFSRNCLQEIIRLSERFLPSQRFPAKAIDLLDEVGAALRNIRNQPSDDASNIYGIIDDFENNKITASDAEELLVGYVEDATAASLHEDSSPFLRVKISDIHTMVSAKTRIPLSLIAESLDNKILNITRKVSKSVISQDEALNSISNALCSSGLGLNNPGRPIGSFLFLGRTGVGKTFLASEVSRHFFGEKALIRFNMSEFSEAVSVNKLVGSSPGYVGYEEGGALIDKVRNNPHCVLLFDEIEKAHSSVLNLLLQILDEGTIEDGLGHQADLKNSIIILTGNIGSSHLDKSSLGFSSADPKKGRDEKIIADASALLSPELINRLSDIIIFKDLDLLSIEKICEKEMNALKKSLKKKKVLISWDKEVVNHISKKALEEKMGGRPIRRIIKKEIESRIISIYLKASRKNPISVKITLNKDKIVVK